MARGDAELPDLSPTALPRLRNRYETVNDPFMKALWGSQTYL